MTNNLKKVLVLTIIGILLIVSGLFIRIYEEIEEVSCYHLPPNEFYKNSICEKYWKTYEK